jgi:hypothetical protein
MPSSSSSLHLGLPQLPKSLLPKLQLKEQGHGIFPIGVILGLIMIYAAHYFSSPYRKLPPGPRGYPIIGNLLDLRSGQWLKFAEWRKKYGQFILSQTSVSLFRSSADFGLGDLIYLNAAGQPIVVLNSRKVAADLLDRRATIYSDRPLNIVGCDIMTGGLMFALSHYDDV